MTLEDEDRPRLLKIVRSLIDGTRHRKVAWSLGAGDSFVAQFVSGSVVITSVDQDGRPPFILEALDENGRTVASGGTLRMADFPASDPVWNDALVELYRVGRASALNVDRKLDELLRDVRAANQPADDDIPF